MSINICQSRAQLWKLSSTKTGIQRFELSETLSETFHSIKAMFLFKRPCYFSQRKEVWKMSSPFEISIIVPVSFRLPNKLQECTVDFTWNLWIYIPTCSKWLPLASDSFLFNHSMANSGNIHWWKLGFCVISKQQQTSIVHEIGQASFMLRVHASYTIHWSYGYIITTPMEIKNITSTSWWLNQPIWKIFIKLDHFPRDRGEHKKYLKPPPRLRSLGEKVSFTWPQKVKKDHSPVRSLEYLKHPWLSAQTKKNNRCQVNSSGKFWCRNQVTGRHTSCLPAVLVDIRRGFWCLVNHKLWVQPEHIEFRLKKTEPIQPYCWRFRNPANQLM